MSTISPSIFDWENSVIKPNSFDLLIQIYFNSLNVIDPYCDCSLSPNRLRFGPLIIIILLLIKHLYTMKKIKIEIKINGKVNKIDSKINLFELIKKHKVPLNKVAIELNKEIVDKKKLKNISLKKNDKIEIVHFIGGG